MIFRLRILSIHRTPITLHYYVWRWYSQIAGGSDEAIRHAISGEVGNDINISGLGFTGKEKYKIASYNRTKSKFTVLHIWVSDGSSSMKVTIPSTIQDGKVYNNASSLKDFRGEGFVDGDTYQARFVTKNISRNNGKDLARREKLIQPAKCCGWSTFR